MNVKVAIIGAGASGLQCAYTLLNHHKQRQLQQQPQVQQQTQEQTQERILVEQQRHNHNDDDILFQSDEIIIIEARDRVGGRIDTTMERYHDDGITIEYPYDHGAAWIHGTGTNWLHHHDEHHRYEQNPMVSLLQKQSYPSSTVSSNRDHHQEQESATKPSTSTSYYDHLKYIVDGNPWMRPYHILHERNEIALYVDGTYVENDSIYIKRAIQQHHDIFYQISQMGQEYFRTGNGIDTFYISVHGIMQQIMMKNNDKKTEYHELFDDDGDEESVMMIDSIVSFYQNLVECWYGAPLKNLPLCEFTEEEEEAAAVAAVANDDTDVKIDDHRVHHDHYRLWDGDHHYIDVGDYYGPHCTMKQGMKTILQPLLSSIPSDRIILNQEVIQIMKHTHHDDDNDQITITTSTGTKINCHYCVVTIPAGYLQKHYTTLFQPLSLSEEKIKAINQLKMGTYKKVFLTFSQIFWPAKPAFLGLIKKKSKKRNMPTTPSTNHNVDDTTIKSEQQIPDVTALDNDDDIWNTLVCDNLWARDGIPCIEIVLFGKLGEWAKYKSDEIIKDRVLQHFYHGIGIVYDYHHDKDDNSPYRCLKCHITRWEEDPYCYGAYTSTTLGCLPHDIHELNRPEWNETLYISGEGTIVEYEGSVHAAILSGMNTAKLIIEQEETKQQFRKQQHQMPS